ncbi:probable arginine--tRNA ligase, mitochondrial [Diorhabda carinulata]|uniref:probable arginine--tRNA ligase, mitochondrial n=1 Tax=Diorhabda carinulata TaxID=1163345 RepID=UPI0025A01E77|nr:probable arginine--tRNA ligase, mitochondrial [Diorhabda carinulata]
MSSKLKLYLGRKVIDSLHKTTRISPLELQHLIQIGNTNGNDKIELSLPVNILEAQLGVTNVTEILKIEPDDIIKNIQLVRDRANRKIAFEIDRYIFVKDVMENCSLPDLNFKPRNVLVEYSSPNIAKPFHFGHLRSTIIGNFIGNLNDFLRNKVTKLNYLGNWGTQYGFIKLGVNDLKYSLQDIEKNPLQLLYQCYVHANKLAENNPRYTEEAKKIFAELEGGSEEEINNWQQFMEFSKLDLIETYKRLGITFDVYNFESDYKAQQIKDVLTVLRKKNIIHKDKDGKETALIGDRNVTVVKSDGTTLYLTRDIAAALDRFKKYNFDKMYYVVDSSQSDHFHALKNILYKMDLPWANRITHVKFGRILGMSTRKGSAIFLKDILDECRDRMIKKQIESPTTKAPIENGHAADILGVSCIIINDLKRRRQKDYEFVWDQALQAQGDTGIKLQYAHCRLYNLEDNTGIVPAKECVPEILLEPEAVALTKQLAKFHDILYNANEQLEAYILVNYLFQLCNQINKAFKTLQVKGQSVEIASQRLLLFKTAREVLGNGMTILGLRPLKKM